MQDFKNVKLIVVFNYSNCVVNKDIFKIIYGKHLKKNYFLFRLPCNSR